MGGPLTSRDVLSARYVFTDPFAGAVASGAPNFAVSNDQNLRDSYLQQWNFNIQKKLIGDFGLDAGYVGSKGTRLIVTFQDLNRPLQFVDPRTPGLASLNARRRARYHYAGDSIGRQDVSLISDSR